MPRSLGVGVLAYTSGLLLHWEPPPPLPLSPPKSVEAGGPESKPAPAVAPHHGAAEAHGSPDHCDRVTAVVTP